MLQQKTKRIVVAFQLAGEPGRRKLGGFLRYLAEHELAWELQFVRMREEFSAEFVSALVDRNIDGIIYSMPSAKDGAAELSKLNIPTVALNIYDEQILLGREKNLVYISGSPEETGSDAAQHFLSQGIYRSYGFVGDLQGHTWSKLRGEAFVKVLRSAGLSVARYRAKSKDYDLPNLSNWIRNLPKPAAVFAAFDDRAIQVLEACHEAKVVIPDDVAVLGVDNDEMLCANTTPPLTSLQPDHDRMGYLAAERLSEMLNGKCLKKPDHLIVGTKTIVIRESTSPISNAGRLVQRALAYIRANATEAIKPRDVAEYLKVSRSLADLRFRELQHESIGEAIRHYRLEEVRQRLSETNDTIENIANSCHFAKLYRLNEAFTAAYGCPLKQYRTTHRRN